MPNIKLYGRPAGTSFRAHWMLHEVGQEYETVPVNISEGENRTEEYLKKNPMGQVPVLEIDGFCLPESVAINHYLGLKFKPELLGTSLEEQGEVMRWSAWALVALTPPFGDLASVRWTKQELPPEKKAAHLEKLGKYLPVFEMQLEGKEYIMGSAFTVADINVRSTFKYGESVDFDFSLYPNIVRYLSATAERPAYKAASEV
jgi:glutathione S-transferase